MPLCLAVVSVQHGTCERQNISYVALHGGASELNSALATSASSRSCRHKACKTSACRRSGLFEKPALYESGVVLTDQISDCSRVRVRIARQVEESIEVHSTAFQPERVSSLRICGVFIIRKGRRASDDARGTAVMLEARWPEVIRQVSSERVIARAMDPLLVPSAVLELDGILKANAARDQNL